MPFHLTPNLLKSTLKKTLLILSPVKISHFHKSTFYSTRATLANLLFFNESRYTLALGSLHQLFFCLEFWNSHNLNICIAFSFTFFKSAHISHSHSSFSLFKVGIFLSILFYSLFSLKYHYLTYHINIFSKFFQ